jgi:hypothetical protein
MKVADSTDPNVPHLEFTTILLSSIVRLLPPMLNLVSSSCPLFFEFACSVSNLWVQSHEIDKGIFVLNEKTITSAADTGINFLTVSSLDVTS